MQVDALASGSSGNAYLLRSGQTAILVEAGLPASKLVRFLAERDCPADRLDGILLTHAHSDHLQGARELSDRFELPIYATVGTLGHRALRDSPLARPITPERTFELGELEVRPFAVPHDCVEPVGFRISGVGATCSVVTDLGFVPERLPGLLAGSDLLVLEANHDAELLQRGPYPAFLKRRVAGRQGHLSNREAGECLQGLVRRPPAEVWLAHLSLVNNRVEQALDEIRGALAKVGLGALPVDAAGRNRPSLSWRSGGSADAAPRQLSLF